MKDMTTPRRRRRCRCTFSENFPSKQTVLSFTHAQTRTALSNTLSNTSEKSHLHFSTTHVQTHARTSPGCPIRASKVRSQE